MQTTPFWLWLPLDATFGTETRRCQVFFHEKPSDGSVEGAAGML